MRNGRFQREFLLVLLLAFACFAPTVLVSFPAALALVVYLPGRFLVRSLIGVGDARGRQWTELAASWVLMVVVLDWIWVLSNARLVVWFAVLTTNLVLLLLGERNARPAPSPSMFPTRRIRVLFAGIVLWIGICVFGSFWFPYIHTGAETTPAQDYIKHHAVMLSLEQSSLPLRNLFYALEADHPYYYYHYFYLVPAALRCLCGNEVSIPFTFGLAAALIASVFIALVYLLARAWLDSASGALLAAACVSIVGGFDVIPVLIRLMRGGTMVVTLDAWCPVSWRIHNLATQFFWCPQHLFAVVALLLCVYWLRLAPGRAWWLVIGPVIGAAIFGSSAYLAMTIFPAAAIYVLTRIREAAVIGREAVSRMILSVAGIAGLGGLLMGRQALHYAEMQERYGAGLTMHWDPFPLAALGRLVPSGPFANYLDAPWILLIDFGLCGLGCVLVRKRVWRSLWADSGARLLLLAGGLGILACFTFRSNVFSIDYGFRVSVMPAMTLAAVCAGALMRKDLVRPFAQRHGFSLIAVGVFLGLPVGLYEVPLTATRTLLQKNAVHADAGALAYLREQTPRDAVIQADPRTRVTLAAVTNRQVGVLNPDSPHVGVFRLLDPARMRHTFAQVESAFSSSSSKAAYEKLLACGVDYVLIGSAEKKHYGTLPQFDDPSRFEPVYTDASATVYRLLPPVQPRLRGTDLTIE